MTTAIDIVRKLQSRGIELAIEGEVIRMRGHGDPLTDTERQALSRRKGEVIAFLRSRETCQTAMNATGDGDPNSLKSEDAVPSDVSRHGFAINGHPKTWTGKIVSLDAWRQLSEWERHGPNGRQWNGITRQWELPE